MINNYYKVTMNQSQEPSFRLSEENLFFVNFLSASSARALTIDQCAI